MNPVMALILAGLGAWQGYIHLWQQQERSVKYRIAREYADSVGKPLLVVGGPWGSSKAYQWRRVLHLPAHACGDVCIDIDPDACNPCPLGTEFAVADIRDIPYPDGYFGAAFSAHTLEHLDTVADCERAVDELVRVADKVYIAGPLKQSIPAWISTSHHLWARQDGDIIVIEQRDWPPGHLRRVEHEREFMEACTTSY